MPLYRSDPWKAEKLYILRRKYGTFSCLCKSVCHEKKTVRACTCWSLFSSVCIFDIKRIQFNIIFQYFPCLECYLGRTSCLPPHTVCIDNAHLACPNSPQSGRGPLHCRLEWRGPRFGTVCIQHHQAKQVGSTTTAIRVCNVSWFICDGRRVTARLSSAAGRTPLIYC